MLWVSKASMIWTIVKQMEVTNWSYTEPSEGILKQIACQHTVQKSGFLSSILVLSKALKQTKKIRQHKNQRDCNRVTATNWVSFKPCYSGNLQYSQKCKKEEDRPVSLWQKKRAWVLLKKSHCHKTSYLNNWKSKILTQIVEREDQRKQNVCRHIMLLITFWHKTDYTNETYLQTFMLHMALD